MTKTAINTRTQEEYDALMEWCKKNNYTWPGESLATDFNAFSRTGKQTGICIGHVYPNKIGWSNILAFERQGIPVIPYTEFAKANIEPDWKALYLKGRELLDEAMTGLKWYQDEYPDQVNGCDDEFEDKVKAFLTKHNDLTNHKDGNS